MNTQNYSKEAIKTRVSPCDELLGNQESRKSGSISKTVT
ncbi:hypothetical protein BFGS084_04069 [Bacteroides fragilis]|nr:hypothetical protein BFGS084_04069 [Bacteroides fragilis]